MQAFTLHTGLVAPMDRENVDTDAIIPKQFLKSIRKTGFGPNLFDDWRYLDAGEPGQDPASRQPNPGLLSSISPALRVARPSCWRARTLAAAPRANTRPGRWTSTAFAPSSRRVLPTSSSTTASKNGLLPIVLPEAQVARLFDEAAAFPGYQLTIDLHAPGGGQTQGDELPFEVQAFRKYCLAQRL